MKILLKILGIFLLFLSFSCNSGSTGEGNKVEEEATKEKVDGDSKSVAVNSVDIISWEDELEVADPVKGDADGIDPEDIDRIDIELATELSELGDRGIKKKKKKPKKKDEEKQKEQVSKDVKSDKIYYVIAGSFAENENAYLQKEKLQKLGYQSEILYILNPRLNTVIANRYFQSSNALELVSELKEKHGIETYIAVKRDK